VIIDLLGGTYENRFKDWNAQRTINWYPKISDQKSQEKDKTQMALFPRPGLSQFVNLTGDSVRGLFTAHTLTQERCFAVVGTSLYEITYDGSSTLIGALTGMSIGSRSKVYMEVNSIGQLMIQDTQAGYVFDLPSNVLTKITTIDYPGGSTLDYADGYFIISDNNGRVSFSDINSGFTWPGFNFFTPSFKPDSVKAIVAFREEIYCFGEETIEIYINDGTTPFIRQSRTSMYNGLTARDSIAVHQAGVFFLGRSRNGGSDVYMMGQDYSIHPLSSPAIAQILNQYTNEDAEGYVLSSTDGHIFYHLHLPALKTTLVYDLTTGMWHERQSQKPYSDADGAAIQSMYRARNYTEFKGLNLYGDWWSGKIFLENSSVSTDDGNIRALRRISPIFQNEQKYISVYRLEFDVNSGMGNRTGQGSAPIMMMKYSLDGGNTFEREEMLELGALGIYDQRVCINNLGTSRNWVIDFSITDPIDIVVMQAVVHGSYGAF
jgi:hypothetical protein